MPYPCCCENRGECFACKGDIPFVDAKIENMRQAESPVHTKETWTTLVGEVETSDEERSETRDSHGQPLIIKPYGTNIDSEGKFWYPEGPSRWCTTTEENSNPDIRTSQTGGGDVCSGFTGNSDSNGWKRCYRVEAPKEFPTYTWSEYVGYDQPYPHLNYPPAWEDLQAGTSYEAFDVLNARELIPTRQALCQWVSPWTPICGESLEFNWDSPYPPGHSLRPPDPPIDASSSKPGELYAGRYQVWFYNEMWKMIWEILNGDWVKLIKFDRPVCQELFGEGWLNDVFQVRGKSVSSVWEETIKQGGELLANFFLEHGIDLREGRSADKTGWETGALIGVSQGWENWTLTHKLIEKLSEWGFDYNVLHGRMDVHQFHCDPNKFEYSTPDSFDATISHLSSLDAGRGPTYNWILCAAGTSLNNQRGTQDTYWWKGGGGYLSPQPIKINNPFWRLPPTSHWLSGNEHSFAMAWAERHYWTSNGPYKPYGDPGYIPRPNRDMWFHHTDPAWVDGFTVERMLHEWTYSDSRQYPFNCTLGGLSGQSGVTFEANPQPDGGYGTFRNPRLNCGTHDEDTAEHEARQPHRIPYAGSNDTMNIDTNRHENFDAEWVDISLQDRLDHLKTTIWDLWPDTREEAEQKMEEFCRTHPDDWMCRPAGWEAREAQLMRNKEDTPWEKTDWFKGATEQYGLSRVLPPSGEKQEDKCMVGSGSGGGSFLVHVPDFDPQTEDVIRPLGPSDDRPE